MKRCKALIVLLFTLLTSFAWANQGKVLVVVPNSFVRESILLQLQVEGYRHVLADACEDFDGTPDRFEELFAIFKPDFVIVDGTSDSAIDSMLIDTQVIQSAYNTGVKKLIVLSSFAIYPARCTLPFRGDDLLKLKMDAFDTDFRVAKITALKQCHEYNGLKRPRFIFCPYPYLCGPNDTGFSVKAKHPLKNIAARILRAKVQKENFAMVSNDGEARYEMIHVDDLARAAIFLLTADTEQEVINIGYGRDTKISAFVDYVKGYLQFKGEIIYNCTDWDDVPRLLLDSRQLDAMGWTASYSTQEAVQSTVRWLESKAPVIEQFEEKEFILP